jgi:Ca2+-binding RTX toxin-like protein
VVSGTDGAETITVKGTRTGRLEVKIGNAAAQTFPAVARLIVLGNGGSDTITIGGMLSLARFLFGGPGNDTITDGNGTGVQVGADGKDRLTSGSGRDILIGGVGIDTINGGNGADILVAGPTTYDTPTAAHQQSLCAIEAEWSGASTYADRIGHLRGTLPGGLNGTNFLNAATLVNDASVDVLNGKKGVDWFLLNSVAPGVLDTADRSGTEVATDVT